MTNRFGKLAVFILGKLLLVYFVVKSDFIRILAKLKMLLNTKRMAPGYNT